MSTDLYPIRRALLSVTDKAGLLPFAQALHAAGVELISTGGTKKMLAESGLQVKDISDVTGFPEIMDGRVKTLHPKVHGGLLARRDKPEHVEAMREHGIEGIDLVVINLYAFSQTVASGADFATCIENIDIGGPAMIRASAKNHAFVAVVTDPADYELIAEELAANDGQLSGETRAKLAAKAFALTAHYDAMIAKWLVPQTGAEVNTYTFTGSRVQALRYGENPHQTAAFYSTGVHRFGVATARQLQGKELSYNNINDTNAAFELVAEFDPTQTAACAIIKHANPCGVAVGENVLEAYKKALVCDPVSAFGGIVAFNQKLTAAAAKAVSEIFTEVIIAPDAEPEAIEILSAKKNLRLLLTGGLPNPAEAGDMVATMAGGFLVQSRDAVSASSGAWKVVTKRTPSPTEIQDMVFAMRVTKHVKSNAIVMASGGISLGVGAGQMNRLESSLIAGKKAAETLARMSIPASSLAAASDAFFPFADGLEALIAAGVTAVIQPGGAMRDAEVIEAADAAKLAMVFTGTRHFKH